MSFLTRLLTLDFVPKGLLTKTVGAAGILFSSAWILVLLVTAFQEGQLPAGEAFTEPGGLFVLAAGLLGLGRKGQSAEDQAAATQKVLKQIQSKVGLVPLVFLIGVGLVTSACIAQAFPPLLVFGQAEKSSCETQRTTTHEDGRVEKVCEGYDGVAGGAVSGEATGLLEGIVCAARSFVGAPCTPSLALPRTAPAEE